MNRLEAARSSNAGGEHAEYRAMCHACRRPRLSCYCALIEPFESAPRFVILTQPREAKHRLGTGRMAHLCLRNSILLEGVDFSCHRRVNEEIARPGVFPLLLYSGEGALSLSRQSPNQHHLWMTVRQRVVIFVLDGTWKSVRKMLRVSPNLAALPKLCFEPAAPSGYWIRRQPRPYCYSTLEAIHFVLDWFAPRASSDSSCPPAHHNLLNVFHAMVDRQLAYTPR